MPTAPAVHTPSRPQIAVFMPSLTGGGAERMLLRLAEEFVGRGLRVDLLLSRVKGDHDRQVPDTLPPLRLRRCSVLRGRTAAMAAAGADWPCLLRPVLTPLSASWALRYLPALADYLRTHRPETLLAANSWCNLVALWARRLAGTDTRIVVSERIHLTDRVRHLRRHARWRHLPGLLGRFYPEAAGIVAVSEGVADDIAAATGLPRDTVQALPNPVVSARLHDLAAAAPPHPWLAEGEPPVVLGVGRLHPQKDFPTLLAAFARLRRDRPMRLIILGEGAERSRLEHLIAEHGLSRDVDLPGHVDNPFAFMSRGALFVLSSRYEGLPGALIQAMACGCPSVSTDCPSGPREILRDGALGPLVAVGDIEGMTAAMRHALDTPVSRDALRDRAAYYNVDRATDAYLEVLLPGPHDSRLSPRRAPSS